MPKRIAEKEKRVPLNCLVLPKTKAWLKAAPMSQGEAVDNAVECAKAHDAKFVERYGLGGISRITQTMIDDAGPKTSYIEKEIRSRFKAPLLKPSEKK
jgi:hypothetical protein